MLKTMLCEGKAAKTFSQIRFEVKSFSFKDAHNKENGDRSTKDKHHYRTIVMFRQPKMRCIKMRVRWLISITNEYVCFDIDLALPVTF